jgi:putative FmdB family regulatory protein
MPIYEYSCKDCNAQFEKFVRSMTSTAEVKCPKCGGTHTQKGWSLFGTAKSDRGLGSLAPATADLCSPGGT